ncbi:MAG: hypothetical protein ACE5I3_04820 [Phycisphaerae bacterium]
MLPIVRLLIQTAGTIQTATALEKPTILEPLWACTVEAGVEWCAPVGGEPATALLICTKDARLDLIDLKTGRSRLPDPIPVQPGMQFAGQTGNVAYGCGPSEVYAFRVETGVDSNVDKPGLLWQVAAAPKVETEGDPEFLTRIIAANATRDGLLIVRSDGRVAELSRPNGSVRWRRRLPTFANCTLHVRDAIAALLWKHGNAFSVAFFDLQADPVLPTVTTINDTLPIWTGLIDDGLVTVWPHRFGVLPTDGKPRFHKMHEGIDPTAATVAVYAPAVRPAGKPATTAPAASGLLLLNSGYEFLCAYDLATGGLRWPEPGLLRTNWRFDSAQALWVSAEFVLCTGPAWFVVHCALSGDNLSAYHFPRGSTIGAGVNDGFWYALSAENNTAAGRGGPRAMRLVRQIMTGVPWSRPNEPVTPEAREFLLGEAGPIRDTFWLGGTLVIVEEKRVRVYALP